MRLTIITSLLLVVCNGAAGSPHVRRDLISDLVSAASTFLNGGQNTARTTSTTLTSASTTATPISSSKTKTPASTQSSSLTASSIVLTTLTRSTASTASSQTITSIATTATSASSVSSASSSTSNSTTTTITSSDSTTVSSTTSSSTSTTPIPSNPANAAPSRSPAATEQGGISSAGIAVAVILSLFILATIAWLVFRYHPRSRAWWAARQEKKYRERSYRDAIDGQEDGSMGSRLRERGPAGGGRKSTYLASFFAPRTVNLGDGKEIRRKPVQWGAKPGEDKVPLSNMASPMGRSPVSPLSMLEKPLPTPTIAQRTTRIYELP